MVRVHGPPTDEHCHGTSLPVTFKLTIAAGPRREFAGGSPASRPPQRLRPARRAAAGATLPSIATPANVLPASRQAARIVHHKSRNGKQAIFPRCARHLLPLNVTSAAGMASRGNSPSGARGRAPGGLASPGFSASSPGGSSGGVKLLKPDSAGFMARLFVAYATPDPLVALGPAFVRADSWEALVAALTGASPANLPADVAALFEVRRVRFGGVLVTVAQLYRPG
jgi:hypothetical protein